MIDPTGQQGEITCQWLNHRGELKTVSLQFNLELVRYGGEVVEKILGKDVLTAIHGVLHPAEETSAAGLCQERPQQ